MYGLILIFGLAWVWYEFAFILVWATVIILPSRVLFEILNLILYYRHIVYFVFFWFCFPPDFYFYILGHVFLAKMILTKKTCQKCWRLKNTYFFNLLFL